MNRTIPAAVLILFTGAPWAWSAETSPAVGDKPAQISFELFPTKHIALNIKANGKGPYRVIFDTGAPMSILSNRVAKETELLGKASRPAFSLFGSAGPATLRTLQVGTLTAKDVPVMVMDHPVIEIFSKAFGRVEGIVGFPFFARYRMTLDYQAKTMTLVPNGYQPPDVLQSLVDSIMGSSRGKPPPLLAPAAQWGLRALKEKDDDRPGVTLAEVMTEGPAAAAGLKAGDRLLTLDGRWTDSVADLFQAAASIPPGTPVKAIIRRGNKERGVSIKPVAGF
jgi:hypothetical protein